MRFPRFLLNIISQWLPPTRLFAFKRKLYGAAGLILDSSVSINSGCVVLGHGKVIVGRNTWIGVNARFIVPNPAQVSVGSNCDIAPDVMFVCGTHELGDASRRAGRGRVESITVGSGVWIGARAVLLPGVQVGNGCMIAAGSVVLEGVYPPNTLIAGNPARVKKTYE